MVCLSPVGYGVSLETSAKHHIPQTLNIPYQPLLIKPKFSVLAHAKKQVFFKTSLPVQFQHGRQDTKQKSLSMSIVALKT